MAEVGFSPATQVFEAAGAAATYSHDRLQLADAGRRRVLAGQTARHRAKELEAHIAEVAPARARNARRRSTVANAAAARPSHP